MNYDRGFNLTDNFKNINVSHLVLGNNIAVLVGSTPIQSREVSSWGPVGSLDNKKGIDQLTSNFSQQALSDEMQDPYKWMYDSLSESYPGDKIESRNYSGLVLKNGLSYVVHNGTLHVMIDEKRGVKGINFGLLRGDRLYVLGDTIVTKPLNFHNKGLVGAAIPLQKGDSIVVRDGLYSDTSNGQDDPADIKQSVEKYGGVFMTVNYDVDNVDDESSPLLDYSLQSLLEIQEKEHLSDLSEDEKLTYLSWIEISMAIDTGPARDLLLDMAQCIKLIEGDQNYIKQELTKIVKKILEYSSTSSLGEEEIILTNPLIKTIIDLAQKEASINSDTESRYRHKRMKAAFLGLVNFKNKNAQDMINNISDVEMDSIVDFFKNNFAKLAGQKVADILDKGDLSLEDKYSQISMMDLYNLATHGKYPKHHSIYSDQILRLEYDSPQYLKTLVSILKQELNIEG